MGKITFDDKVKLKSSPLDEVNKLTADNINEIKTSVNALYDEVLSETVTISSSDIKAMNGAAVDVISAETGYVLGFVDAILVFDEGDTSYSGGGDIEFVESGTGTVLSDGLDGSAISGGADSINILMGYSVVLTEGKAIQITNQTAAFADGDGVLRIKITYRKMLTGL